MTEQQSDNAHDNFLVVAQSDVLSCAPYQPRTVGSRDWREELRWLAYGQRL